MPDISRVLASQLSIVISFLSLVIALATAFGIAERLRRWCVGPQLSVDFPGIPATSGLVDSSRFSVRIPVANQGGRLPAINAKVYVEDIRISAIHSLDPSKRAETLRGFVPMCFKWSHDNGIAQTIPSGERRLLDLCILIRNPPDNSHRCYFYGEVQPPSGALVVDLVGQVFEIALSISTDSGVTVKQKILLNPRIGNPLGAEVSPIE